MSVFAGFAAPRRFSLQLMNTGVSVSAVTQLSIREISSTWNSDLQYSPVESCDRPIGAKASIAITVAPSRGRAVRRTIREIACCKGCPRWWSIFTPSTTTMPLSTSMLSEIISAPSDTRCSSSLNRYMISSVPSTFSASDAAITMPLRRPINSSSVPTTIASAIRKLRIKPSTDCFTSCAWL